jgi:hypothetical protein
MGEDDRCVEVMRTKGANHQLDLRVPGTARSAVNEVCTAVSRKKSKRFESASPRNVSARTHR